MTCQECGNRTFDKFTVMDVYSPSVIDRHRMMRDVIVTSRCAKCGHSHKFKWDLVDGVYIDITKLGVDPEK